MSMNESLGDGVWGRIIQPHIECCCNALWDVTPWQNDGHRRKHWDAGGNL